MANSEKLNSQYYKKNISSNLIIVQFMKVKVELICFDMIYQHIFMQISL